MSDEMKKVYSSGDLNKFIDLWLKTKMAQRVNHKCYDAQDWLAAQIDDIRIWVAENFQTNLGEKKDVLQQFLLDNKQKAGIIIDEIDNKTLIFNYQASKNILHIKPDPRYSQRNIVVLVTTHEGNVTAYCDHCGLGMTDLYFGNKAETINDKVICHKCFETNYGICDDCNEYFLQSDLRYHYGRGCNYCDACDPGGLAEVENEITGLPRSPASPRHTGFELESCFTNSKKWEAPGDKHLYRVYDDGSLEPNGGDTSMEVCTQPTNDFVALEKVLAAIKTAGGYVNHSCGGHVHVDARDIKQWFLDRGIVWDRRDRINLLCKAFAPFQTLMFGISEPSRITGTYCHWTLRNGANSNDRYRAMNLEALHNGTIEFRMFSGSLDEQELKLRGKICRAVVEKIGDAVQKHDRQEYQKAMQQFTITFDGSQEFGPRVDAQDFLTNGKPAAVKRYMVATCGFLGLTVEEAELAYSLFKRYWRE